VRFFLVLAAAGSLLAQPNPRELVRQSIRNGTRAWETSRGYAYVKKVVDEQFDSQGQLKSTDVDVYDIVPVHGDSFAEWVSHDGKPIPPEEAGEQRQRLAARERETPQETAARLARELRARAFYQEIPDAFDFRIVGEEDLPTGPAWVLDATPRPGFQPKTRYARMFPKMRGKLWIDKKDIQWVKADAVAAETVTFGFFIARLSKGSHIVLEQTRLPDGTWVPHRILARASARTFLVFNHNFEEDITYSDFRKPGNTVTAAREKH